MKKLTPFDYRDDDITDGEVLELVFSVILGLGIYYGSYYLAIYLELIYEV